MRATRFNSRSPVRADEIEFSIKGRENIHINVYLFQLHANEVEDLEDGVLRPPNVKDPFEMLLFSEKLDDFVLLANNAADFLQRDQEKETTELIRCFTNNNICLSLLF